MNNETTTDLLVVGAGIIGLAHAALAVERGLSVRVIERDHRAVGASIRNFGHCCITAQSGELLRLAQVSRRNWLRISELAGLHAAPTGAVVLAHSDAELAVLKELSASREPGQVVLLDAAETRAKLGPAGAQAPWPGLIGGAFLRDDLRVDPRTTVGRLADWVDSRPQAIVHWNTPASGFTSVPDGVRVTTPRGDFTASQVVVCVGHDLDHLFPEEAAEHRIQRCSLNMALGRMSEGFRLSPAVLTATSMLRYPAFVETEAAAELRDQVTTTAPELLEVGANIMFTQRPDGTVILGDSHHYHRTAPPFLDESVSETLLEHLENTIGERPRILERWQGVYASSEVAPLFVQEVLPDVTAVSVTSGVGMTLSFGVAERTIDSLFT
ncbi:MULTISPECIES: TIGR03364 family FAD-dependent oxidoreductase [Arthrobacter]|uniref:TIGR03364 family FAD-dependent oxidoreductase n=2 Tax=Arthrobacter TaxID=1663 RepID=A0ABU9KPP2_9MICC|nr:TIGR03364 family FAD-dependent oxidoreductase [Arthrobacter sp. YJM1]MDP5227472.1 TIGR03364 family FAD-dependent oxidoreductase [Arthrobacter sp. YJM1]